jgi:hypothetical protein
MARHQPSDRSNPPPPLGQGRRLFFHTRGLRDRRRKTCRLFLGLLPLTPYPYQVPLNLQQHLHHYYLPSYFLKSNLSVHLFACDDGFSWIYLDFI